jgi:hypothetical protein
MVNKGDRLNNGREVVFLLSRRVGKVGRGAHCKVEEVRE